MHLNFLVLYWACKRECIVWICESWGSMGCDEWDWISHANNQCWLGLQQWVVPKERILMWTSCKSYIKSALFVLICCLRPTLCMATFGLAMPITAPYLFIYSIYHSFIFWYPNSISKLPIFTFIHSIFIIFVIIIILFTYLFIYLFLKFHL